MSQRYGLELRAANAADATGLAELLAASGRAIEARDLAARVEAIRSASGTVLLATEWGPPSGVVALHWYPSLGSDQKTAAISALLVDPAARRRGIGRLLVKAAAQAARVAGCGGLTLCVGEAEAGLEAFCLSTGFLQNGMVFERGLRKK